MPSDLHPFNSVCIIYVTDSRGEIRLSHRLFDWEEAINETSTIVLRISEILEALKLLILMLICGNNETMDKYVMCIYHSLSLYLRKRKMQDVKLTKKDKNLIRILL